MIISPVSAQSALSVLIRPASTRQADAALPADYSARVSISQAARERYASEIAAGQAPEAPAARSRTWDVFDTNRGSAEFDLDSYLMPTAPVDLDSAPLLAPTRRNIEQLSQHVSERMPAFLAKAGIPAAPAQISYDRAGQIELPADYPYAADFRRALENDPGMARALTTTAALSSHLVEMEKAIPFQEAYRAAGSQAELQAVIAKYADLLSGSAHPALIALHFSADGVMSLSSDGETLVL